MQFSKLYLSLATICLATKAIAAPAKDNNKRDDAVVVRIKTTVRNVQTNTLTVEGTMSTKTNVRVDTSTATVTRYTATVTSTVFGVPHTYTTVATTPIQAKDVEPITQNEVTSVVETDTNIETTAVETTAAETSSDPTTDPTADPSIVPTLTTLSPAVTSAASIPISSSWIIENVTTITSNNVCFVDYDYYYATESEADETVTSTSTIYTIITQA